MLTGKNFRSYEIIEKSSHKANWGRDWTAALYLDVKTSSFTRQDEFYAYDIWDLTSSLGGLMGLFIGWSFLSILYLAHETLHKLTVVAMKQIKMWR